ncbi:single-stranded-DNA-specific exonuclease RecJ [Hymenobacter sp. ASUV-10]|uniref:Single-stranded-DNA-specific exonuclease RecJ n=1 Tax=Hymenobacter aranciens TaxID=3063996 RepID=A0ABT9B4U3_9BACT|nr:single-stranded-DNA-specific exonuclease RecJ [Hymenobacter sp. ASUV-10]MDO7873168.1 single-stranded-DNA-specific exonuclease RecJ [Hymenobacter sp. ASUV-10]
MPLSTAKRWNYLPSANPAQLHDLLEALPMSPEVAELLVQRGVDTPAAAAEFFQPDLQRLPDPLLMRDMDRAVTRLAQALADGEKVLVLGDYDVDGITSVAMVMSYLTPLFGVERLRDYIPDRYTEGYGISLKAIDFAADNSFALIVALDCGVKALEQVAYAASRGVDFIICDHHLPGDELPAAVAVLDPKRQDCEYPYKELSGCGVGFKLMQALGQRLGLPAARLYALLDLVTVSIAADIVPITGENRVLAAYGLRRFNEEADQLRPGLAALRELATLREGPLGISSLIFGFAPRINAAGRMGDARRAVAMLLAPDQQEARYTAEVVDQMNRERRGSDQHTTQEALDLIAASPTLRDAAATVLYKADWHQGVLGIVASRCLDQYYRPTVILTMRDGKATGSARSVAGFDIHTALETCAPLLEQFGGHRAAAGLTLKVENVPAFQQRFEEVVAATLTTEQLVRPVDIALTLPLSHITEQFYTELHRMEPFGPGNPNPVFASQRVLAVPGSARVVGQNHLKLRIIPADETGPVLDAIGFGLADYLPQINEGQPFDVCYTVEMNEYRGIRTVQLRLLDVKWE